MSEQARLILFALLLFCAPIAVEAVVDASALQASEHKTLFYYSVNKHIGAAFIRQMRSDIARATRQMSSLINDTLVASAQAATPEEREEARQLLREVTVENHIFNALFKWNMAQVVDESCRRYEMEIDDPCVSIDYDDVLDKCRVNYNCKITEIAPGQRAASPISDTEARERFEKSQRNSND